MGEALTQIEQLIIEYLYEFGNTREVDLIDYVAKQGYSPEWVKKAIKKLYGKKIINKIPHPNRAVYLTLEKDVVPLEMEKEIVKAKALLRAAEVQAYAQIDAAKPKPNMQRQTIQELVENLIQTRNECLEAVRKLKAAGFKFKKKDLNSEQKI